MPHAHAWSKGGWTHSQEGRLLRETGSMAHHDHIAIDGTYALAIYAPPREFTYDHPGSPDDCQSTDSVPAKELTEHVFFDFDAVDVARPPGAHTPYDTVIMDGIVLLRLPLERRPLLALSQGPTASALRSESHR